MIKQLRRVLLNKTNIYKAFLIKYQVIKDLSGVQSSDQCKISPIKILNPGRGWFYRPYESDYPLSQYCSADSPSN